MISKDPWTLGATFGIYLAGMLALGVWSYMRTRTLSDYVLGGRSLGPFASALSAGASDMSGWLLIGLPGYAYVSGLEAGWIALGLFMGTWLNWKVVARRLRAFSETANNALTLPEFFENRFDDDTHTVRVVCSVFILLFFLFYTAAGLVAAGKLFETTFDMSYRLAVLAGTVAIVSYTLFGGFLAVVWTDVVQGLLMSLALVIVPVAAVVAMGGISHTTVALDTHNSYLLDPLKSADGSSIRPIVLFSLLGWGLGYFGQPHILARFKAIRKESEVRAATRIAVTWSLLSLLGAVVAGIASVAFFDATLPDPERAFMLLIGTLFHPIVAGVLLAAILAAVMSTADSQLLVASSTFTEDFYKTLFRRGAGARELLRVGRIAVAAIAGIAAWIALDPDSGVLGLVGYAWAGFGAAFGPALILSLYWPRMTMSGVLAGVIVGGITVIVWKNLSGGIFELYEIIPAFALSAMAVGGVSMAGRPPSDEVLGRFDRLHR